VAYLRFWFEWALSALWGRSPERPAWTSCSREVAGMLHGGTLIWREAAGKCRLEGLCALHR
jgi:hypothetical protein